MTTGVSCGDSSGAATGQNPFLKDIFEDLYPLYLNTIGVEEERPEKGKSSANMDGHLMYIFGIVVRDLRLCGGAGVHHPIHRIQSASSSALASVPNAYSILFESVRMYPYNW